MMPFLIGQDKAAAQALSDRVIHWEKESWKRLIPVEDEDNSAPNRQGYRKEIDEWMGREGIETVDDAARHLAVSVDVLKSIRSDKGRPRYSDDTLNDVLAKTGIKKK